MRIMRVLDKEVGNQKYFKYRINLPVQIVKDSGFLDEEILVKLEKGKIVIEKGKILKQKKDLE